MALPKLLLKCGVHIVTINTYDSGGKFPLVSSVELCLPLIYWSLHTAACDSCEGMQVHLKICSIFSNWGKMLNQPVSISAETTELEWVAVVISLVQREMMLSTEHWPKNQNGPERASQAETHWGLQEQRVPVIPLTACNSPPSTWRHNEWPRLVFGIRGAPSSGRFSWLYPGSDSRLPAKGREEVSIYFPSMLTGSPDPRIT